MEQMKIFLQHGVARNLLLVKEEMDHFAGYKKSQ
jgi:hypothetical protein